MKDTITLLAFGFGVFYAIIPTLVVLGCVASYLEIRDAMLAKRLA